MERSDKSLTALTAKFMSLIAESKNGVLDLRSLVDSIPSRQKRRVYDITNVLEGIGLIEKNSKNSIRWKAGGSMSGTLEDAEKISRIKSEVRSLEEQEHCLDEQIQLMQSNLNHLTETIENEKYCYVTYEDLCQAFPTTKGDESLFIIRGNDDTIIEVPEPMYIYNNASVKQKYHMSLKSDSGPIDLILVNRDKYKPSDAATSDQSEKIQEQDKTTDPYDFDDLLAYECFKDHSKKTSQNDEDGYEEKLMLLEPGVAASNFSFELDHDENFCRIFQANADESTNSVNEEVEIS